jgi:hypothetical protein
MTSAIAIARRPYTEQAMSKDNAPRRAGQTFEAIAPGDGKRCEVRVTTEKIQSLVKRGMGAIKEAGVIVPFILLHPTAIFEGLCREEDEDKRGVVWLCYCGIPTCDFTPEGREVNARVGRVFLVFVNDECVAYNWRWERADSENSRLPLDVENRFRRQLV